MLSLRSQYLAVSNPKLVQALLTIHTPKCNEEMKIPCLDIVGLFDESFSMRQASEEMNTLIETIVHCAQGGGTLTILFFSKHVRVGLETTEVPMENLEKWKMDILSKIGKFSVTSTTNTNAIMMKAVEVISTLKNQAVVFLATDGDPTCGEILDPDEIALNVIDARQEHGLTCGNFDFVVLGIGEDLDIIKCQTIGEGLHPDVHFLKTKMETIAGDIGKFLGDVQMFKHGHIELTGCVAVNPEQLHLRNIKFDQLIHVPVMATAPVECRAKLYSDCAGLQYSCALDILQGETEDIVDSVVPWICCSLAVEKLIKKYNREFDEDLIDKALSLLKPFETVEADNVRALVEKTRIAAGEHDMYSQYQSINDINNNSSNASFSTQTRYNAVYNKRRAGQISGVSTTDVTSRTLLTKQFDTVLQLLASLEKKPTFTEVTTIVLFSDSDGCYMNIHRNHEGRPCCDKVAGGWCYNADIYKKPVSDLNEYRI
jgi:hypothetical protein